MNIDRCALIKRNRTERIPRAIRPSVTAKTQTGHPMDIFYVDVVVSPQFPDEPILPYRDRSS